jgi:hypothetical protein
MSSKSTPYVDVDRAKQLWADYCAANDTSKLQGKTAVIEPVTGRIWFGESATDVSLKMQADGVDAPGYAVRVGFDYYLRKGGRR